MKTWKKSDGFMWQASIDWIIAATIEAEKSGCQRNGTLNSRCGAIIVKAGRIIGQGFNSPPGGLESQRRCGCDKSALHRKVTDKTCCVHAEQRAIIDALRNYPDSIVGSRLYFVRVSPNDDLEVSGNPYCTICSKIVLDVGIAEFVLFREEGICVYDTEEYNLLSYQFKG